ncbi:MAG: UDP-N-acetylmuramoyl-L-alanyl-D-glutamate--2,6-diaminopimelate ligase [Polyangiaceae bacterium]
MPTAESSALPDPAAIDISLTELASHWPNAVVVGDASTSVRGVFQDSRRVTRSAIFAVRSGQRSDGRAFLQDAASKGAAALLVDDHELAAQSGLPAIVVDDVRRALGALSMASYGVSPNALSVVGLTGTNGKTTTSYITQSLLLSSGRRTAALGTLGCNFDGVQLAGSFTTPEADDLARTVKDLVVHGATHLVMEVSSHALALHRADGLSFAAAGFTNLTQDHLDFHGTFEAYGEAKALLFTERKPSISVINIDDPFGASLASRAELSCPRVIRVSPSGKANAQLRVVSSSWNLGGLEATVAFSEGAREDRVTFTSPLVGAHNLENLCVSLGIAYGLGIDMPSAAQALTTAPPVPGRLERCNSADDDILVVVDYAHTPDALSRVLSALRPLASKQLWCAFGCGGDRDPKKRPLMGAAVAQGADRVVVTNDNPRSEDPREIARAIEPGIRQHDKSYEVILDRAEAIERVIAAAEPGDVVLIAGKVTGPTKSWALRFVRSMIVSSASKRWRAVVHVEG